MCGLASFHTGIGLAVVIIVLVIGALNFGLGFGLAVFLERPLNSPYLRFSRGFRWRRTPKLSTTSGSNPDSEPDVPESPEEETEPAAPQRPPRMNFPWLPSDWADLLYEKQVAVQSFPEALLWVAQHEVRSCCDQLQQHDQDALHSPEEFHLDVLKTTCAECRSKLNALKTAICECKQPGSHGDLLVHFIQWVQESDQKIEEIQQVCQQAETDETITIDCAAGRRHLLATYAQLQTLSERSQDALAKLFSNEKRLGELSEVLTIEPHSCALNRLGMETVIQQWMEKDPDRVRMASAMLVDLDECSKLNEKYGMAVTSQILSNSLGMLVEVVRKDRGFDRVIQLAGPTFLIFLGDTAMRNAIVGAERVRQNIAAAQFKKKDATISITASCTVTEWNPSETFDDLMMRLRTGIIEAKNAGRNCTVACGPDDLRVIESSRMQVTAREFALPN